MIYHKFLCICGDEKGDIYRMAFLPSQNIVKLSMFRHNKRRIIWRETLALDSKIARDLFRDFFTERSATGALHQPLMTAHEKRGTVAMQSETQPVPALNAIAQRIFEIRGQRVMLDTDLATLYDVPTFRLNEAVKRNRARFPEDFMFQLTKEEYASLRSQFAMSKPGRGGRRTEPFAFTEQGVAMLSSVLNSEQAVQVNIAIFRAFIWLRKALPAHQELTAKVAELEAIVGKHDVAIGGIIDALNELILPPDKEKRRIGF